VRKLRVHSKIKIVEKKQAGSLEKKLEFSEATGRIHAMSNSTRRWSLWRVAWCWRIRRIWKMEDWTWVETVRHLHCMLR
jgi:hypothetical protein